MEEAIGLAALILCIIFAFGADNIMRLVFIGGAMGGGGFLAYRLILAFERRPLPPEPKRPNAWEAKVDLPTLEEVDALIEKERVEGEQEAGRHPIPPVRDFFWNLQKEIFRIELRHPDLVFGERGHVLAELHRRAIAFPRDLPALACLPSTPSPFTILFYQCPDFRRDALFELHLIGMAKDIYGHSIIRYTYPGSHNPFNDLALFKLPIPYTDSKRFEHTVILGSAGSGKTTLLSHLILFDLHQDNPPSLILIDPKRTVIRKLSRLALFNDKLKDRLIVISPKDHPAINIFDTTNRSSSIGAIQSVEYLCGMLGQDMTGKQSGFYRNIANLLLHFKEGIGRHATLDDLIELTYRKFPEQYASVVAVLPPVQRRFFERGDFESSDYRDTKEQIRTRLNALLASEGMSNLFTAQDNAINVFEEMNKGSIILVDTGEGDPLDKRESGTFGCIFMAEIVRAILQRTPLEKKGHPTFVYVDEAATFFIGADILEDFLTSGRQNNVGGIFAFHDLKQAGEDLRQTLVTNTSTKILSKYAVDDIATFGRHMKLTIDELQAIPDYHWACAIRGVADKAVTITCPADELDNEPIMSEAEYQAFLRKNWQRVGGKQQRQPPPPQKPSEPPHRWTEQDEQALADAEHQRVIARRRKDVKRVKELTDIIEQAEARKKASQDYYQDEDAWRL